MFKVSDIDLRLLRVFSAIVEAGGFAAAETTLNISTSTISTHVSDLEKRLGFRLCDRGRGGFRLTERGKLVYEETKRLSKTLDDFAGTLSEVRDALAGRLVIGFVDCLVTHPNFPLTRAIRRFNQSTNNVEFELVTQARQELERAVLDGRIHVAIGPFIRNISGLNFHPLFSELHQVYCGPGHPMFGQSVDKLENCPSQRNSVILRSYHHDFDRSCFGVAEAQAIVASMEAMLVFIRSGRFIGFLPTHFAEYWVEKGELWPLDALQMDYSSDHMLITRAGGRKTELLNTITTLLKEEAANEGS